MTGYVVEVNEARIPETGRGAHWWAGFRQRFTGTDRCVDVGGLVHVPEVSWQDAHWVLDGMVAQGVPASALQVRAAMT